MPTREIVATGRVQGVFYRGSAQQKATELGLTGWVKNMPDGSVLMRITGSAPALAAMKTWCTVGPAGAQVDSVSEKDLPDEIFDGFCVVR